MVHEGVAHWLLGYPQQGLEATQRSLALARKIGHPHSLAIALVYGFMMHQLRRELSQAAHYADAVVALSTEHDFKQWLMMGEFFGTWCGSGRQPRPQDLTRMQEILERYRLTGANRGRPWFLALLAERSAMIAPDVGLEALDEAIESVKNGERWYEAELRNGT
jgi:predicted ATPase